MLSAPFCMVKPGNTNWGGRLSTVDLLIKVACFVEMEIIFPIYKGAYLNQLVQGGQLYLAFQLSKISLVKLYHGIIGMDKHWV
jgi:hypothetical protein